MMCVTVGFLAIPCLVLAETNISTTSMTGTLLQDKIEIVKAEVEQVVSQTMRPVPGTDVPTVDQNLKVLILEGDKKGQEVFFDNDYLALSKGDIFYLMHTTRAEDGSELYAVKDPDRMPVLYFFTGLFILTAIIFGGLPGLRGLISLGGSIALIIFVLLPSILHGFSPIIASIGVASLIIVLGSYVTHGFNRTTTAAVIGMVTTVIVTGILAYIAVHAAHLSGYENEEFVYLNFNTRGAINFVGLLLGGIIIGLLGVLYDSAISQAIAVEELHHIAPDVPRVRIFQRALRIGREHIGALINTLAIAYVGASLPLLLLFYSSTSGFILTINQEIFATEIIRTMIGSLGLVLAVPITTFLATVMLIRPGEKISNSTPHSHSNGHSHRH